MRLLLACLVVLLAPAGALLMTARQVDRIETEFEEDALSQIARLDRVTALYPPNVRKLKTAPAIMQLKQLSGGGQIAATACATPDSPYQRLFERLNSRCVQWGLFRRARYAALFGAVVAVATWALILISRIVVRRFSTRQEWPGNWTLWFVLRGIPVLLLAQIAVSLFGYGVLLQEVTGRAVYAAAILILPFGLLFWLERRLVLAFVEPEALSAYRPRGVAGVRRRRPAHS